MTSEGQKLQYRKAYEKYYALHKDEINLKNREKRKAMSEEEKEIRRAKQREAYYKRKAEGKVREYSYDPLYYQANRERIQRIQYEYNARTLPARQEYQRRYHEENKETILAKQKIYRNKPEVLESKKLYQRQWYADHPNYRKERYEKKKQLEKLNAEANAQV